MLFSRVHTTSNQSFHNKLPYSIDMYLAAELNNNRKIKKKYIHIMAMSHIRPFWFLNHIIQSLKCKKKRFIDWKKKYQRFGIEMNKIPKFNGGSNADFNQRTNKTSLPIKGLGLVCFLFVLVKFVIQSNTFNECCWNTKPSMWSNLIRQMSKCFFPGI